jgi:uncharacterized protein YdeI (YjbR/CyaY-like superfamily)
MMTPSSSEKKEGR